MSADIERMLEECLAGLDAGLTPDECLSAWPESSAELEPLLRQAMLLQLAYAANPDAAFRERTREKLMFMAGREARQALAANPEPAFVAGARARLLNAAGASARETLRSVPPPRLAFWLNARRRLLEAAAAHSPRPVGRSPVLAFRTALSGAVVALVIAVAGLAYFASQPHTQSVSAELAAIEQQLREVEQQTNSGNPEAVYKLVDLSRRISVVAQDVPAPLAPKTNQIIEQSKQLASKVTVDPVVQPDAAQQVQEAQQQLDQAQRLLAARADAFTPSALAQATAAVPTAPATLAPQTTATPAPPASSTPTASSPAPTTAPLATLGPNQVRIRPLAGDSTAGLNWVLLETNDFQIAIPANWTITGLHFDANGVATLEISRLRIEDTGVMIVNVDISTGEIQTIVGDGPALVLRAKTVLGGKRIDVNTLISAAPTVAAELNHMLDSVVHVLPTPTPTASPSSTPPPPPAVTPTP
jgi:hypothetical protein